MGNRWGQFFLYNQQFLQFSFGEYEISWGLLKGFSVLITNHCWFSFTDFCDWWFIFFVHSCMATIFKNKLQLLRYVCKWKFSLFYFLNNKMRSISKCQNVHIENKLFKKQNNFPTISFSVTRCLFCWDFPVGFVK